jgi:hypothetical protein
MRSFTVLRLYDDEILDSALALQPQLILTHLDSELALELDRSKYTSLTRHRPFDQFYSPRTTDLLGDVRIGHIAVEIVKTTKLPLQGQMKFL